MAKGEYSLPGKRAATVASKTHAKKWNRSNSRSASEVHGNGHTGKSSKSLAESALTQRTVQASKKPGTVKRSDVKRAVRLR